MVKLRFEGPPRSRADGAFSPDANPRSPHSPLRDHSGVGGGTSPSRPSSGKNPGPGVADQVQPIQQAQDHRPEKRDFRRQFATGGRIVGAGTATIPLQQPGEAGREQGRAYSTRTGRCGRLGIDRPRWRCDRTPAGRRARDHERGRSRSSETVNLTRRPVFRKQAGSTASATPFEVHRAPGCRPGPLFFADSRARLSPQGCSCPAEALGQRPGP